MEPSGFRILVSDPSILEPVVIIPFSGISLIEILFNLFQRLQRALRPLFAVCDARVLIFDRLLEVINSKCLHHLKLKQLNRIRLKQPREIT